MRMRMKREGSEWVLWFKLLAPPSEAGGSLPKPVAMDPGYPWQSSPHPMKCDFRRYVQHITWQPTHTRHRTQPKLSNNYWIFDLKQLSLQPWTIDLPWYLRIKNMGKKKQSSTFKAGSDASHLFRCNQVCFSISCGTKAKATRVGRLWHGPSVGY